MGTNYSFLFLCPWLPLKTAFKETSEKASYTLQPLRLDPSFASFLKHWPSSPADSCMLPSFSYYYLRTKKHTQLKRVVRIHFPVMPNVRTSCFQVVRIPSCRDSLLLFLGFFYGFEGMAAWDPKAKRSSKFKMDMVEIPADQGMSENGTIWTLEAV